MPKEMRDGDQSIDNYRPPDRRLTEGGIWRRKLPPYDRVRVLGTGLSGKRDFKGEVTVRIKPVGGGQTVNYIEEDFLLLFEPIISAVMED